MFHKTIISFRNLKTNLRTNFIRAYIISYIANCNILAQGLYTFCLYFDILDSVSIYLIKVCTDSKNNSRGIRRIILITGGGGRGLLWVIILHVCKLKKKFEFFSGRVSGHHPPPRNAHDSSTSFICGTKFDFSPHEYFFTGAERIAKYRN